MCKVVLQSPILNCIILGMLAGGSGNILGDSSRSCGTGCSGLGEAVGTGSEVVCGWNQRWRSVAWPTLAERVQGFSPSTLFSRSLKQAPAPPDPHRGNAMLKEYTVQKRTKTVSSGDVEQAAEETFQG